MKNLSTIALLTLFSLIGFAQADKIVGKWKTIDDKDGSEKSIVAIYKAPNGKFYGKIEKLFKEPEKICTECQGTDKNKPILGLVVINDMTENEGKLTGGTITDPQNGKVYKCNISLEKKTEKLIVRGSLDKFGLLGRSQTWIRVK